MPTYGKTSTGASWHTCELVYNVRSITVSSTETAVGLNAYLRSQGSATNGWKMGLWDVTDDSLDYQSSDMSGFTDTTGQWRTATFTSSVTADTYWLGVLGAAVAGGGNTIQCAYDTVSIDQTLYLTLYYSGTYPTLENPINSSDHYTGSGTHDFSLYLETTAAGGATNTGWYSSKGGWN